jgi:hypothetical protein
VQFVLPAVSEGAASILLEFTLQTFLKPKNKCGGETIITEAGYSRIHFRDKTYEDLDALPTATARSPMHLDGVLLSSSGTSGGEPKLFPSVDDEADRRQLLGRRRIGGVFSTFNSACSCAAGDKDATSLFKSQHS